MGRITVFTGADLHSKRVKAALEKFELPFVEISLENNVKRRTDLHGVTGSYSVPQVFFNTRFVGGAKETMEELEKWSHGGVLSPLRKYQEQIEPAPEPSSKILALPPAEKESSHPTSATLPVARSPLDIQLPDGTMTTIVDITEKLRNTLTKAEVTFKGVVYKRAFTGKTAVKDFMTTMDISREEAVSFGKKLLLANVVTPVATKQGSFDDSADVVFRLQCDQEPGVLNSYCVWNRAVSDSCLKTFERLDGMLREIEEECINTDGKLDYRAVYECKNYPLFEEAVCELQVVNLKPLTRKERLAFGLNVYHLMLKYAFMKVGIVASETEQKVLMSKVKFNVGSQLYTFEEWIEKVVLGKESAVRPRLVTPLSWLNSRANDLSDKSKVIFAMNVGAHLGSSLGIPFRSFSTKHIGKELVSAAHIFLEDDTNFTVEKNSNQVFLSKVLSWFRSAFSKNDKRLLLMLADYLTTAKKIALQKALDNSSFAIVFQEVDCTRNAVNYPRFDPIALETEVKGAVKKLIRRLWTLRVPPNESLRLSTLRSFNQLEALPEERFDRITRMVQSTFEVPLVFVSLVDEERIKFRGTQWLCESIPPATETGREGSFCGYTILGGAEQILHVPDATQDDRFADSPLVTGPLNVRFYAGCNLTVPAVSGDEMVNIGTLCIIDQKPRELDQDQEQKLRQFASQVREEIVRQGGSSQKPESYVEQ